MQYRALIAVVCSLPACASPSPRELMLRDKASTDLGCPADKLKVSGADDDIDRTVEGCGNTKLYHFDKVNMIWKGR